MKNEVDEYIAAAPKEAQPLLRKVRAIIKANAPQAEERISYRMPYYDHHGRLVYFAAQRNHVGVYALGQTYEAAGLQKYVASKGTLRFPFDEKLPEAKLAALIRKRVRENEAKVSARPSAKTRSKA
ncbi:MAG TPA: DUF1801 domain-containing protein [Candidatus Dormibacteraeota bacterium]|nr:DUF1801 domain-containing protein [Candidatus Dormibacteraeota bacterium]